MDRLRSLNALIAVVESGSFVAAAQRLHSSKAAISRYIQELETYLGVRLLQRSTRRVALTEAGRDYYQRAKQILADLDDADSAVGANNASLVGNIRINAPLTFGTRYLAPLWAEFMARHPAITLDIELTIAASICWKKALIWRSALAIWPIQHWFPAASPTAMPCYVPHRPIWKNTAPPPRQRNWHSIKSSLTLTCQQAMSGIFIPPLTVSARLRLKPECTPTMVTPSAPWY